MPNRPAAKRIVVSFSPADDFSTRGGASTVPVPPHGDLASIIRALETFTFDRADRLPADLVTRLLEKAVELDQMAAEVEGHLSR